MIRKKKQAYEILSGNHRVIASREAGLTEVPCMLVDPCDDKRAARIAVNMNTVHGEPTPELLAPFLAEMDDSTMKSLFIGAELLTGLVAFDETLRDRLSILELPEKMDRDSNSQIPNCVCKCGNRHIAAVPKSSLSSRPRRKTTAA